MKHLVLLRHLFQLLRTKYYYSLFNKEQYFRLVETNVMKAIDLQWIANYVKKMNRDAPQTLDEKVQWLQARTDTTKWSELSDKYEVRKYVADKGWENHLIPCYGIWEKLKRLILRPFQIVLF